MDLKKFKKLTNDETKVRKIVPYSFLSTFDHLLVTRILNYYTLEVVIYNNKSVNKWRFYLNEVNTLDDKLSIENKEYLRNKLADICLHKYFKFKVLNGKFQEIIGNILFEDKDMQINSSVNTMMVNMTINLIILKYKLKNNVKKNNFDKILSPLKKNNFDKIPSPLKKSFTIDPPPLTTIKEDEECDDFVEC